MAYKENQIQVILYLKSMPPFYTETNTPTPTRRRLSISSMPLTRVNKRDISAPLQSTAVDLARGRFMRDIFAQRDDSLPFAALALPCAPIQPPDHGSNAREDNDMGIFEPRRSRRDLEKENIFEPPRVKIQSDSRVPFPTGDHSSLRRPPTTRRNYVIHDPSGTLRPLSPIHEHEDDLTRRHGCHSFATFEAK